MLRLVHLYMSKKTIVPMQGLQLTNNDKMASHKTLLANGLKTKTFPYELAQYKDTENTNKVTDKIIIINRLGSRNM